MTKEQSEKVQIKAAKRKEKNLLIPNERRPTAHAPLPGHNPKGRSHFAISVGRS